MQKQVRRTSNVASSGGHDVTEQQAMPPRVRIVSAVHARLQCGVQEAAACRRVCLPRRKREVHHQKHVRAEATQPHYYHDMRLLFRTRLAHRTPKVRSVAGASRCAFASIAALASDTCFVNGEFDLLRLHLCVFPGASLVVYRITPFVFRSCVSRFFSARASRTSHFARGVQNRAACFHVGPFQDCFVSVGDVLAKFQSLHASRCCVCCTAAAPPNFALLML